MRNAPFVCLCLCVGLAAQDASTLPEGAPEAMAKIDAEGLRAHATFLASDELGGRYTTSPGQVAAAEYIAAHFEKLGLEPLGDGRGSKRSYFQEWPVEREGLVPQDTRLEIGKNEYGDGFAILPAEDERSNKVKVGGGFTFCGYGDKESLGRVRGKIAVVVLRASGGASGGRLIQQLQKACQISDAIAERGGKVCMFCLPEAGAAFADNLNYMAVVIPGKPIVQFGKGRARGQLRRADIPAVFLSPQRSRELLAHLGASDQGGEWQQEKRRGRFPGSLRFTIERDEKAKALNVAAVLPGSGASKEAVVFSAHMDHMGTRYDGDPFNGADDNASGTSSLLEVAEAFASGEPPSRSVVFLAVSGEELGLWGSAYYADNPTWPADRIVADVNIDMIGREGDISNLQQISATPSFEHPMFSTLVRDSAVFAAKLGLEFTVGDKYYQRSDHYNFAKKDIPVVFFCDGEHADYHKVTDHVDKLDFGKIERVARLAYWTGYSVAQDKGRPKKLGKQSSWTSQ